MKYFLLPLIILLCSLNSVKVKNNVFVKPQTTRTVIDTSGRRFFDNAEKAIDDNLWTFFASTVNLYGSQLSLPPRANFVTINGDSTIVRLVLLSVPQSEGVVRFNISGKMTQMRKFKDRFGNLVFNGRFDGEGVQATVVLRVLTRGNVAYLGFYPDNGTDLNLGGELQPGWENDYNN